MDDIRYILLGSQSDSTTIYHQTVTTLRNGSERVGKVAKEQQDLSINYLYTRQPTQVANAVKMGTFEYHVEQLYWRYTDINGFDVFSVK